jgi:hypothetical protein
MSAARRRSEPADRGVRHSEGPRDGRQCFVCLAPCNCLALLIAVARRRPGYACNDTLSEAAITDIMGPRLSAALVLRPNISIVRAYFVA